MIYVTEGAVTAPGQTNLGIPVLDGPVARGKEREFSSLTRKSAKE